MADPGGKVDLVNHRKSLKFVGPHRLEGMGPAPDPADPEPAYESEPQMHETSSSKIQDWIETVATGETDLPPLDDFASVSLADVQPGEGEIVVRFNAVGELGLSFYENTLAVAMVDPGSQASASSSVEVGMLLTAVQGDPVGHMPYEEAMEIIDGAGRPLLLTFKRPLHREDDAGPVMMEGDLLKLEPNLFASIVGDKSKEAHRRYFVVQPDQVTYQRAIGSEVILHFSMIHDISLCDETPNLSGDQDRAFETPGERPALFTITMNGKYRKPWRVYVLQAPSYADREQWLKVCKRAKKEFVEFGPWRTRRNYDARRVTSCSVERTRRVECTGLLERDYVLYVIECQTAAGNAFQIERRFSDFVSFHERWMERVESPYAMLPIISRLTVQKNDPMVILERMMLLDAYLKAVFAVADRIGSKILSAALQQFLSIGASEDGDYTQDGHTDELETVWDELSGAGGDIVGASFDLLHSSFDVVGRWVYTEGDDLDSTTQLPIYTTKFLADGTALLACQGHADAMGRGVFAIGTWASFDEGRRVRLKFETATDVVQNPPADAIGRVSNFIIEYRKVCATQVFSVAGICDDTNSGEHTAYRIRCTSKEPSQQSWTVLRRFTNFDELRKRLVDEYEVVDMWDDMFPGKFSLDRFKFASPEAKDEALQARRVNLGIWLQKVVEFCPQNPALAAFLTEGAPEVDQAVTVGQAQVLESIIVNSGISWGVDDLERRRNLVREKCTIGDCVFSGEEDIMLRVEQHDIVCASSEISSRTSSVVSTRFKYRLPPRFDIFNELD